MKQVCSTQEESGLQSNILQSDILTSTSAQDDEITIEITNASVAPDVNSEVMRSQPKLKRKKQDVF